VVVQLTIPSYVYSQYADDDDIQAFVAAFNTMAQVYINTMVLLGLPLYPQFTGPLLDWVCNGIYGYARPILPSGNTQILGPYNTIRYSGGKYSLPYGMFKRTGPSVYYATSDDVYIRCVNWHFFKGDGKQFTIPWLKRRVARFLWGPGSVDVNQNEGWNYDVSHEYQISVTFGTDQTADINIVNGAVSNVKGTLYNKTKIGSALFPLNHISAVFTPQMRPALASIFKAAVESGILELPFQYTWVVNI